MGDQRGAGDAAVAGRPLAVFDLDGTVTRFDTSAVFVMICLWRRPWRVLRLLAALPPAGLRFALDHDRGRLKGALLHAALAGLTRAQLEPDVQRLLRGLSKRGFHTQALTAIADHRERGHLLALMSASPELFVPQLGATLGFEQVVCTRLRWRADGALDGHLAGPNCRGEEKLLQLGALIERQRPSRVYAYGNSRADLPHMQLADEAYLVNAAVRLGSQMAHVQRLRWRA